MPQQFDLLVFDWDGTLMDSAAAIVLSIQGACRDLGYPVPDEKRASHVIGLGLRDAMAHACPELRPSDYDRMIERYRYHWFRQDPDLPLFAGTVEMLAELEDRGHLLAVATGKSRAGLARVLENTGLHRRFVSTRCADQCTPKPAPDMLLELIDELGADRERTLMIGDTTHDLNMAANAGVPAVAVSYGAHPPEELEALSPLAIVDSTPGLHQWLRRHA
ncbi:MAG TPA: HAD-IA family hydrolase [Burkholderiales bacterium]|nr:HAD-IA family hydrolase [Burkholderiales bacterium]